MRRPRSFLLLTLVAVVALAACGSDSDDSSSSTSTTRAPRGASPDDVAAVVVAADNATLGRIVVNDRGLTVYTFTDAAGNAVACEGSCLEAWPPVVVEEGTDATGGEGVEDVGVVTGPEGDQVSINGLPVYTFAGDSGPGDAQGEGIAAGGGTWHVVKVSGGASGAGGTTGTTDTTKATTDPYDY